MIRVNITPSRITRYSVVTTLAASADSSIGSLADSHATSLRAAGRSERTIGGYRDAVNRFTAFLVAAGRSDDVTDIRRADIDAWLVSMREAGHAPASVANRYRSLRAFLNFVVEEGEIDRSPMVGMRRPTIPDAPPAVLRDDQIERLLRSCEGTTFDDRRDNAIVRLLLDTGMRRGELVALTVGDLDFEYRVAVIRAGKGGHARSVPFGHRTTLALQRYLRARAKRPAAISTDGLWIGKKGRLGPGGVLQLLRRRGARAGIPGLFAHMFRHSMAHRWLAEGGQEGDLARIGGWRDRSVMARYGRSAADERAHAAHRRLALGDRF
jgi:site-specific recombinase XerD